MIPLHILKEVLADQLKRFTNQDPGIPRRIDPEQYRNKDRIVVISGVRRSGKSTFLKQLSLGFPSFLYLNADDDRLIGATTEDLASFIFIWEELYPEVRTVFLMRSRTSPDGNGL